MSLSIAQAERLRSQSGESDDEDRIEVDEPTEDTLSVLESLLDDGESSSTSVLAPERPGEQERVLASIGKGGFFIEVRRLRLHQTRGFHLRKW